MEVSTQSYAVYSPVTQTNHLASMNETSWHPNHFPAQSTPAPSTHPSPLFPVLNRSPDLDYPSPAPSSTSPSLSQNLHQSLEQYPTHHHSPAFHTTSNETMFTQFHQVDSSIGPNRVRTRRKHAAQNQGALGRRASMSLPYKRPAHDPTPVCLPVYRYFHGP